MILASWALELLVEFLAWAPKAAILIAIALCAAISVFVRVLIVLSDADV